jgi:hypothetical protein
MSRSLLITLIPAFWTASLTAGAAQDADSPPAAAPIPSAGKKQPGAKDAATPAAGAPTGAALDGKAAAKPEANATGNGTKSPATGETPAGGAAAQGTSSAPPAVGAARTAPPLMSSMDALFKIIPVGRTHEGVRYPVMDGNRISAVVDSEFMTRIDENNLQFENAVIDQRGEDPVVFHLTKAVYNRQLDQLMSTQPAMIESRTYRIEGDSLNYDRKNNVSRMDGRVRMTIFDAASFGNATPQPGKEKEPEKKSPPAAPQPSPVP